MQTISQSAHQTVKAAPLQSSLFQRGIASAISSLFQTFETQLCSPRCYRTSALNGFEQLEPLLLLDGEAFVELVTPPAFVADNELVDITVRYKMTQSKGGPFLIEELSLRDQDPAGLFNRIARTKGQRFSKQDTWYQYTFKNVDLSEFDDGGNGIELYAHVDIDNQAPFRADASDNSPVQRVTVGQADVIVESLDVEDTTVEPGQKIDITAVVKNVGTANARRGRIHYYLGSAEGSRSMEIGWGYMPNVGILSPNEQESDQISSVTIPDWPDGTYYITAVADSQSDATESNENNNEKSVAITIGTPREERELVPVASLLCQPPSGPGVTVITHGFQFGGGPKSTTPDWTLEMAEAILKRNKSGGSILVHDPNLNRWVAPDQRGFDVDWSNTNDWDDEIVLVFDWTWESNDAGYGWQEAAGDSLFANLVTPFGFDEEQHSLLSRPLHFIGHSRGTVVNTMAVSRLDFFFPQFPISQFTTLDPHPSTLHDDPGHDSDPRKLRIPDNIVWADNYYRSDGVYELDNDFDGVPVGGAFNLRLTESALSGAGHLQEHSDVHLWYLATIDDEAEEVEGYSIDEDFDAWWKSGVAFDSTVEADSGRDSIGYSRSRLGGAEFLVDQMDRSQLLALEGPETVFNGHFEFGAELSNQIPGWERHGGGGSGNLDGLANNYLLLNDNDYSRTHNALYVPPSASHLEFDYWIRNNDAINSNDRLEIRIGSQLIGSMGLEKETNGFVRDFRLPLTETQVGIVQDIEFRIGGPGDIQSAVQIDNVSFAEERPSRSIDLEELHQAVTEGSRDRLFDLNHDTIVDQADIQHFRNYCSVGVDETAEPLAGDADSDGAVTFTDFLLLSENFGKRVDAVWADGDFDGDGSVAFTDFLMLSGNFGQQV